MLQLDEDDDLPGGWEQRVHDDGRVYYVNHSLRSTQWEHPDTGEHKRVQQGCMQKYRLRRFLQELPFGWERREETDGTIYFYDTVNELRTLTDPRLAFTESTNPMREFRQRFDGRTTALRVVKGRDLSDKFAVVTGANTGIGYETVRALAFHGAHVVMACRDMTKGEVAKAALLQERPQARVVLAPLDLETFSGVMDFVQFYKSRNWPLHVLVLNAAIFGVAYRRAAGPDGLESTFRINHLGHFHLVRELESILVSSKPARVVVVSSESHRFATLTRENLSVEVLSPPSAESFSSLVAYNNSKLCNVLFSNELNKRLQRKGVTSNALHPGNMVYTELTRSWFLMKILFYLVKPFTKTLEQAAATSLFCATSKDLEGLGGFYFNSCCQCVPSATSLDEVLAERLWLLSDTLLKKERNQHNTQARFDNVQNGVEGNRQGDFEGTSSVELPPPYSDSNR